MFSFTDALKKLQDTVTNIVVDCQYFSPEEKDKLIEQIQSIDSLSDLGELKTTIEEKIKWLLPGSK